MRLAVYNVENLFDRAKAMNLDTWNDGRQVLEQYAELNKLLGQPAYSSADKAQMVSLLLDLGLGKSDIGPFVILRRNRGGLLKRPKAGGVVILADGRGDWVGSLELRDEPIDEVPMRNTARVIHELNADVLGIVEAESRPVLQTFSSNILPTVGAPAFKHVMLIDGNDQRGIDVGLMTRTGFPIDTVRSHVDDRTANGSLLFSRDCPEFYVKTPQGHRIAVLVNHFKSKGFGSAVANDRRRQEQAERVAEIYQGLINAGEEFVAVIGDLNDTPDSSPLAPLINGTNLKDIATHPNFNDGGFPGTYGSCGPSNKIDFILLSPALFQRTRHGGIIRKGIYSKRWSVYPEVTRAEDSASDHAALWADIDV